MPKAPRLYSKGTVLGYRRSQRDQDPNNTLIEIEGVKSQEAARFYLGKRIAYVYPVKRPVQGKNFRVVWGRVTRPHGSSGVVRAKFRRNLPPQSFGKSVRVMLYPSHI